ncbi:MAG: transglutaminase-like domain-containing protein [Gemmatimonadaceae bacterium]
MTIDAAGRRRRGRRRVRVAILVLLAWGGGVGLVLARAATRSDADRLAEAALRLAPGTTFFVVAQDGRPIGYASTSIDTTRSTVVVTDQFTADLPVAGQTIAASATAAITLSRGLALRAFDVRVETPVAPMHAVGRTEGDSAIVFTIDAPGQPADSQRVPVRGPVVLPALIPAVAVLVRAPKVGGLVTLASFDPMTMASATLRLRIDAESLFTVVDSAAFDSTSARFVAARTDTVRAWRFTSADGPGFTGWVDGAGRVVEATQPGGITLRRTAFELAFTNWRRDRVTAMTTPGEAANGLRRATAVSAGVVPASAAFEALRVRVAGVDVTGFALDGGRQRFTAPVLDVRREPRAALRADWSLAAPPPGFRATHAETLRDEPLLQVSDPAIVALAVRIAGDARDPAVVAERLTRWVFDSLEKAVAVTVPSATQVLRTRRGDCNEHAQLFTALARAVGLPTRIATGLTYVDGHFYYHAWPEVWLRDWVAVDPTFGQFPADAAHLRFVVGGLARQVELLRLMGSLQLEVVPNR